MLHELFETALISYFVTRFCVVLDTLQLICWCWTGAMTHENAAVTSKKRQKTTPPKDSAKDAKILTFFWRRSVDVMPLSYWTGRAHVKIQILWQAAVSVFHRNMHWNSSLSSLWGNPKCRFVFEKVSDRVWQLAIHAAWTVRNCSNFILRDKILCRIGHFSALFLVLN